MASQSRGRGSGSFYSQYYSNNIPETTHGQGRIFRGRGRANSRYHYNPERDNKFENVERLESSVMESQTRDNQTPSPPEPPEPKITPQPKIDEATRNWIYELRNMWDRWRRSEGVTKMLHKYFATVPNPYIASLIIITNCPGFNIVKPGSLPFVVIEELASFMSDKKHLYSSCLTPEVKTEAFFTITKQHNIGLIKLIFKVYEITSVSRMFVQPIHALIKDGLFKEACQCASFLGLHDQFTIEDFLVPLIFQDKLTIAEEFLSESVPHQIALVKFLDELLSSQSISNQVSLISQRLHISCVKTGKLYYKPISKMVARFVKLYNLESDVCPTLNEKRKGGALQFIFNKRYRENSISGASWREMILEAVGSSTELQLELVVLLNSYDDVKEATYWALKFQLPHSSLPYNVREHLREGGGAQGGIVEEEDWDTTDTEYHSLNLPSDQIVVIDSEWSLGSFLERAFVGITMVGIDAEWKPAFGAGTSELSLIQIATHQTVYILDVFALEQYTHFWVELGYRLFSNHEILKIGFGLAGDVVMIKEKLPYADIKMDGIGYLDLSILWKRIIRDFDLEFPYPGDYKSSAESLSKLVALCLGRPLDKAEQFSNWERRPLRDSQKIYAALDAFCLLEVYNQLRSICLNQNIPFNEILHDVMTSANTTNRKQKKKEVKQYKDPIDLPCPGPNTEPVGVSWLKVVCDTMLQGLGKQLRKCGVDVAILENSDRHKRCVEFAKEENRVILTKGHGFKTMSKAVPPGYCYHVECNNSQDQMVEVLNYYNVIVRKEDIFSRCMHCNGIEFVKLTPNQLQEVMLTTTKHVSRRNYYVEDDFYDDQTGFSDDSETFSDDATLPVLSYQPRNEPNRTIVDSEPKYGAGCETNSGAHIKYESIQPEVFKKVSVFYICDSCGHVYWDGSHLERLLCGRFQQLIAQ